MTTSGTKPTALTKLEWRTMRRHAESGERLLHRVVDVPAVLGVVRWHHERWDGEGYPDGKRGRQIPLWVEEGQTTLEIALAFFENPLRFRGLLSQAEEDEVAARLDDSDLASAARQIRELDAAAA